MISKDKKRLAVSLRTKTVECMDALLSLRDEKINTYSRIIDLAVVYFYLAINGMANKPKGETHENN